MPRKLASQTFLTRKKHLLRVRLKNHTGPGHFQRFLCISLITTRNFNGSNPDSLLALAIADRAVSPGNCVLRAGFFKKWYESVWLVGDKFQSVTMMDLFTHGTDSWVEFSIDITQWIIPWVECCCKSYSCPQNNEPSGLFCNCYYLYYQT